MRCLRSILFATWAIVSGFAGSGTARAQHFDVLVQQVDGRLVTGSADFDTNQWTLGRRVFFREFDDDFAINNPGFNALGEVDASLPVDSQALPGNTPLEWDFLPMTIDGVSQSLFYWNGLETNGLPGLTPEDVAFGPLPGPNYKLSLFDKSNVGHFVDGTDAVVPGGVIEDTAADGVIHRHRFFFLDDGDGSGITSPVDGIYLLAMRLRMVGLESSKPLFIAFGTLGSSVEALDDAAVPWVEENLLELPGDYNADGVVNAADYTVWRDTLGSTTTLIADGDGSLEIDGGDYDVWRDNFGASTESSLGAASVTSVPEPASVWLLLAALFSMSHRPRWRRGARRRLPLAA